MSKELDNVRFNILSTPSAGEVFRKKAFRHAATAYLQKLVEALGLASWQYEYRSYMTGPCGVAQLHTDFALISVSQPPDHDPWQGVLICPCESRHVFTRMPGERVGIETLMDTEALITKLNEICERDVRAEADSRTQHIPGNETSSAGQAPVVAAAIPRP